MKEADRVRHLKRVATLRLWEADLDEVTTMDQPGPSGIQSGKTGGTGTSRRHLFETAERSGLSIQVREFADQVAVPLEGIWEKAEQLLGTKNATVPAPGCDPKARMVKRTSTNRPHLVIVKRKGQYSCDNTCDNWRSLGICSHSVVVAEQNGELQDFVGWFKKAKKRPNLTKLALTGMPSGRGRKGGIALRKKKKSVPPTSRTPFSVHSDSGEPSCTSVASLPLRSPNIVSTPCLSATDAALLGTDRESFTNIPNLSQQAVCSFPTPVLSSTLTNLACSSPVYSSDGGTACHQPISTQYLSSSTNVPVPGTAAVSTATLPSSLAVRSCVPSFPPPLVRCSPTGDPCHSPFVLSFVSGNIRVCCGCRQKYAKPAKPPMDLCVRHQEWQEFFPPGASTAQVRFGNVYYHCNIPCIQARCPYFKAEMLSVPADIAIQMLPVHSEYIHVATHMHRV